MTSLAVFTLLRRQSDPWLRVVATDLMTRCYAELGEWGEAVELYEEMPSSC